MKTLNNLLIGVFIISSCSSLDQDKIAALETENEQLKKELELLSKVDSVGTTMQANISLEHLYEPHVTIRHKATTGKVHYYSVMMVVKKNTTIYHAPGINELGKKFDRVFAFKNPNNPKWKVLSVDTYSLNDEYQLCIAEYAIPGGSPKKSEFKAVVHPNLMPNYHPDHHKNEKDSAAFVEHDGTIHVPGGG